MYNRIYFTGGNDRETIWKEWLDSPPKVLVSEFTHTDWPMHSGKLSQDIL